MEYKTQTTVKNGRLEIDLPPSLGEGEVEVTVRALTPPTEPAPSADGWTLEEIEAALAQPATTITREAFLAMAAAINHDDWSHIENPVGWVQQQREYQQMRSAWRWAAPSTDSSTPQ